MKIDGSIRYRRSDRQVLPGDFVVMKVFFRAREGQVMYVPGISPHDADFDEDGLSEVGIRLIDGSIVATVVDPQTHHLVKKATFLRRGALSEERIKTSGHPFSTGEAG
jgi:hypothetical protein